MLNSYSVISALYSGIDSIVDKVTPQSPPINAEFLYESELERAKKNGVKAINAE